MAGMTLVNTKYFQKFVENKIDGKSNFWASLRSPFKAHLYLEQVKYDSGLLSWLGRREIPPSASEAIMKLYLSLHDRSDRFKRKHAAMEIYNAVEAAAEKFSIDTYTDGKQTLVNTSAKSIGHGDYFTDIATISSVISASLQGINCMQGKMGQIDISIMEYEKENGNGSTISIKLVPGTGDAYARSFTQLLKDAVEERLNIPGCTTDCARVLVNKDSIEILLQSMPKK